MSKFRSVAKLNFSLLRSSAFGTVSFRSGDTLCGDDSEQSVCVHKVARAPPNHWVHFARGGVRDVAVAGGGLYGTGNGAIRKSSGPEHAATDDPGWRPKRSQAEMTPVRLARVVVRKELQQQRNSSTPRSLIQVSTKWGSGHVRPCRSLVLSPKLARTLMEARAPLYIGTTMETHGFAQIPPKNTQT